MYIRYSCNSNMVESFSLEEFDNEADLKKAKEITLSHLSCFNVHDSEFSLSFDFRVEVKIEGNFGVETDFNAIFQHKDYASWKRAMIAEFPHLSSQFPIEEKRILELMQVRSHIIATRSCAQSNTSHYANYLQKLFDRRDELTALRADIGTKVKPGSSR